MPDSQNKGHAGIGLGDGPQLVGREKLGAGIKGRGHDGLHEGRCGQSGFHRDQAFQLFCGFKGCDRIPCHLGRHQQEMNIMRIIAITINAFAAHLIEIGLIGGDRLDIGA